MASFEELYPSMAKHMAKAEPAHEFQVIEELPEAEPELEELGGRPTTEHLSEQWMTVREAAQALGVVTMTIYRMIKRQDLRSVRFGPRSVRVYRVDVNEMMKPQEKE